jgi:hypothetical protein
MAFSLDGTQRSIEEEAVIGFANPISWFDGYGGSICSKSALRDAFDKVRLAGNSEAKELPGNLAQQAGSQQCVPANPSQQELPAWIQAQTT